MIELIEEIRKLKRPPLMRARCPHINSKKYCAYHKYHGHDIEESKHLNNLVEELIKARKLIKFVMDPHGRWQGKEPIVDLFIRPIPT